MILPIFLPHFGCEKRCIYCDQTYITEKEDYDLTRYVCDLTDKIKEPFEVALYGGDIFGAKKEELEKILKILKPLIERSKGMRVSSRPLVSRKGFSEILELLKDHRLNVVELGIPTFNDSILRFLKRGHTVKDLEETYRYLESRGIKVALQLMVGLPKETEMDIKETVRNVLRLKPHYIRIYPLVVIRGTPLAEMVASEKVRLVSFEEAVRRAAYIYASAKKNGIDVLKIGLTDNRSLRENVKGGFYHPSFGYIVRCYIFLSVLKKIFSECGIRGKIRIEVSRRDVSHLCGYKGENLRSFEKEGVELDITVSDLNNWEFRLTDGVGFYFKSNAIELFEETLN